MAEERVVRPPKAAPQASCTVPAKGVAMHDQDWDDDSEYRSAVRRTRITMAIALIVTLLVAGIVAVAIFGISLFVDLAEALSR
ncbi:hypothetical protein [Streptomyces sp. NPDC059881]|uniref:hypothetical protein n=1 Tax=Streptomyces sp. NPDC059881 TaxID=3346986 RepID=UPI00365E7ECE